MPEIIDPVFAKTSPERSFCMTENERFGLVFVKTGSINSGTGHMQTNTQVKGEGKRVKLRETGREVDERRGEESQMKGEKKFSMVKPRTQTNPRMKERGREQTKGRGRETDKGEGKRVRSRETGREVDEGRGEERQIKGEIRQVDEG